MHVSRSLVIWISGLTGVLAAACGSDGGTNPGGGGSPVAGSAGASSGNGGTSAGSGGTSAGVGGGSAGSGGASAGSGGASAGSGGTSAGNGGSAGSGGSGGGSAGNCSVAKTDAEVPMLLSATGCVDMADPTKPAPGLVPFTVRSPLWSDAATKERFVRIPEGTKIHALDCDVDVDACKPPGEGGMGADEGHWIMPVGTVLVKSFSIEGTRIETRLLMRRSNLVWKGFSYEWNDAGTEATLLPDTPDGKQKMVGSGQTWHYPSRSQCLDCHTRYAGSSLGPSTAQLNTDFAYADGTMNQVEKFKALGLFDTPPKAIAGYPDPAGQDSLDMRARSYLQTNCSMCHRPGGGTGAGKIDLRFATPFAETHLCEEVERGGDEVPTYALVPGKPAESTVSFRMRAINDFRMPEIGSNVIDMAGTKLIDDWITAMPASACPPSP